MTRRDLMKCVLAGSVSGAVATGSVAEVFAAEERAPSELAQLRPEIFDIIGDRDRTKAIAEAYRRTHPNESLDEIERAVRSAAAPESRLGRVQADTIRRHVRREYAEGRTLELDGWILAETEARQCVIYETAHRSAL